MKGHHLVIKVTAGSPGLAAQCGRVCLEQRPTVSITPPAVRGTHN